MRLRSRRPPPLFVVARHGNPGLVHQLARHRQGSFRGVRYRSAGIGEKGVPGFRPPRFQRSRIRVQLRGGGKRVYTIAPATDSPSTIKITTKSSNLENGTLLRRSRLRAGASFRRPHRRHPAEGGGRRQRWGGRQLPAASVTTGSGGGKLGSPGPLGAGREGDGGKAARRRRTRRLLGRLLAGAAGLADSAASLVWTVDSTRCPGRAACTAGSIAGLVSSRCSTKGGAGSPDSSLASVAGSAGGWAVSRGLSRGGGGGA